MRAIGKQMVFIGRADRFQQALAQFILEETYDSPDFLQREPPPLQLADDRDFGKIIQRIHPPVPVARSYYDVLLVPPLQLPQADARQLRNLKGCKRVSQCCSPKQQ